MGVVRKFAVSMWVEDKHGYDNRGVHCSEEIEIDGLEQAVSQAREFLEKNPGCVSVEIHSWHEDFNPIDDVLRERTLTESEAAQIRDILESGTARPKITPKGVQKR